MSKFTISSNELLPILLDVFESWDKLDTIEASFGTGVIYVSYIKRVIKKTLQTIDPFHF